MGQGVGGGLAKREKVNKGRGHEKMKDARRVELNFWAPSPSLSRCAGGQTSWTRLSSLKSRSLNGKLWWKGREEEGRTEPLDPCSF